MLRVCCAMLGVCACMSLWYVVFCHVLVCFFAFDYVRLCDITLHCVLLFCVIVLCVLLCVVVFCCVFMF